MDRLIDNRRTLRACLAEIRVVCCLESVAVVNAAVVGIGTVLDCSLKSGRVPSIEEVTVKAVASGVALGEDEFSAVLVHIVHTIKYLVEEMD